MKEELLKLIYEISEKDMDDIERNSVSDLIDDLGYDSLSILELTVEIEGHFGIYLDDDDLDIQKLRKIDNIVHIVEEALKNIG